MSAPECPRDLFQRLLSWLEPHSVCQTSCACQSWQAATDSLGLWRELYIRFCALDPESSEVHSDLFDGLNCRQQLGQDWRWQHPTAMSFRKLSTSGDARSGHAAVLLKEQQVVVLIFGATDGFSFRSDLDFFDIRQQAFNRTRFLWQESATTMPSPSARWQHAAALLPEQENEILVCGGLSSFGGHSRDSMWILKIETGFSPADERLCWTLLDGNLAIAAHSLNRIGDQLLLFGGKKAGGLLSSDTCTVHRRGAAKHEFEPRPPARHSHAACAVRDALCICGGWAPKRQNEWPSNSFLRDLWLLDLKASSWSEVQTSSSPMARCQAALWSFEDHLFLFGGARHHLELTPPAAYGDVVDDMDSLHVLNLNTRAWLPTTQCHASLRGGVLGMAPLDGGSVLLFGGMRSNPGEEMPIFLGGAWHVAPSR